MNKLSDHEWQHIALVLSPEDIALTNARASIDAIRHILRMGIEWQHLPAQYGNGLTIGELYEEWVQDGTWFAICTDTVGELVKR